MKTNALLLGALPLLCAASQPAAAGDEWDFLPALLEELRVEAGAPGMSVAIAHRDGIEVAVAGVRSAGGDAAVEEGDRFHIGSVAKPMTATMIGRLVEQEVLAWDTTLGEALPEAEMLEVYAGLTIDQLLMHRGGIQPYLTFDDEEDARLQALPGSPSEQRAAFLAEVLQQEPVAPPGTAFSYSNAGYVLAARTAEVATGKAWEDLVRDLVFEPLEMDSTGPGWPATPERPDQPLGHMGERGELEVQAIGSWDVGAFLAPAGDLHASARDLAVFGRMHAEGLAGFDGPLRVETLEHLHAPPPDARGPMRYARGWFLTDGGDWHGGSAGSFYALLHVLPDHEAAVAVLANSGDLANHAAAQKLVARAVEALDAAY